MARDTMVQDWVGYWAFLANRNTDQWARISKDLRRRRYSPAKLLSDTLGFWSDATLGWMSAARGAEQPAIVMFHLKTSTETAKKTIGPFFRPSLPAGDPDVQWFGRIDDGKPTTGDLKKDDLTASWRRKDISSLRLRLRGMEKPITPGTYHALVNVGDEPLALVYMVVK